MNEEQNNEQKEQEEKSVGKELVNGAVEMGKDAIKDKAKNAASAIAKKVIAAIMPAIMILLKIALVVTIVAVLLAGIKYVIDKFVSDKTSETTYNMIGDYCILDETGIHFEKEKMMAAIEDELKKEGIDLNDLGLGSTSQSFDSNTNSYAPTTDTVPSQAVQYMYNFMTAAMTTEFPYIAGSDKEAQGIIKIKRKEEESQDAKELVYMGYDQFTKLVQSTDRAEKEKSKDYFSIDKSWNLCITKSYSVTVNGTETQYEITEIKIPYRTMVSQYSVPIEFLMDLLQVTQNANYVQAVADLIKDDSEIEFTIFDSITTTTDIYTYKHSEMKKWRQRHQSTNQITGHTSTTYTKERSGPDEQPDEVTTTITKEDSVKANVTKAKTWILEQTTEYECEQKPTEYPLGIDGQTNQIEDEPEPEGDTGNWKVDQSENTKINVDSFEWKMKEDRTVTKLTPSQFLGLWKNNVGLYTKGAPYNPKGLVVNYVLPSGKGLDRPVMNILSGEEWLMNLLQDNEKTQISAELMKYLIHLYKTGEELDMSSLFSIFEPDEFVEGTYSSSDFDVHDETLFIKDVESLKKAFEGGYSGNAKLIANAQAFLDMQNTYKVNAIFAASVSITETSAGRAGHATDGHKNWFNIRSSSGWANYSSDAEGINAFGKLIAEGSYYYKQGKYSVGTIGTVYCPNTPEYPTQADSWIADTIAQIVKFYAAAGIDATDYMPGMEDVSNITVVPGDLGSLFPNGIPTSESQMKPYLTTISVVINNKSGKKVNKNLTVHKAVAEDVKAIFEEIQASGFKAYDIGAYTWRSAAASKNRSHHSYGIAIDINPRENYMIKNGKVVAGSLWQPGTNEYSITTNGPVVRAFAKKGWTWGGTWKSSKDYMHFSLTGH